MKLSKKFFIITMLLFLGWCTEGCSLVWGGLNVWCEYSEDSDHCYQKAAIANNNPETCDKIEYGPPRDKCHMMIAMTNNDDSYCDEAEWVPGWYSEDTCISKVEEVNEEYDEEYEEEKEDEDEEDEEDEEDDEDDKIPEFVKKKISCEAKLNHKFNPKTQTCSCQQLYEKSSDGKECYFKWDKWLDLTLEDSLDFQEKMEWLPPWKVTIYEWKTLDGKKVKIWVVRKLNGEYSFTKDWEHYENDSATAVNPWWWSRVKTWLDDMSKDIKRGFGIGKYTGRDTADNPEKQREWQARLDAASAAFKDLRDIDWNPEKQLSDAQAIQSLWKGRFKNSLWEKYEDLFLDELKEVSGWYDVGKIKKVILWDFSGLVKWEIDAIKWSLYTFPADSIVTLAKELRANDFSDGASLYIDQRKNWKDIQKIYNELEAGELTLLEYKQMSGISQQYTQASMLLAYEEAYQRYLLAKQMK